MIKPAANITTLLWMSSPLNSNVVMNIIPAMNVTKNVQIMNRQPGPKKNGIPTPSFAGFVKMN